MRVAARNAEGEPVSAQHAHGAHDGLVRAAPAPRVGGLFETFHRDGRHEVLHAQQVLGERVVDERGVRERGERAVVVLLAETDEVALAHERLSAAEQVEEHAQFLALRDDGVQLLEREVEPVAILGRPAARAVQVAGARRVDEHGPGHVAAVLGCRRVLAAQAQQAGVHEEVLDHLLANAAVHVGPQAFQKHHPVVVGVVDDLMEQCPLLDEVVVGDQRVHGVQDLRQLHVGVVPLRVVQDRAGYGGLGVFGKGPLRVGHGSPFGRAGTVGRAVS